MKLLSREKIRKILIREGPSRVLGGKSQYCPDFARLTPLIIE